MRLLLDTHALLGWLTGDARLSATAREALAEDGFVHLPISHVHALRAGGYGCAHRDPFDRLLAAQAEIEQLPLVTRDAALVEHGCRTFRGMPRLTESRWRGRAFLPGLDESLARQVALQGRRPAAPTGSCSAPQPARARGGGWRGRRWRS